MNNWKFKKQKAFTLIELLVVIAIIGLLATIVMVSLSAARKKARIARRITDGNQLRLAIELYYDDNDTSYPSTGGLWRSKCPNWGGLDDWIPGLAPTYIGALPLDPQHNSPAGKSCYLYRSNGVDYKLLIPHDSSEMRPDGYMSKTGLIDPRRDGGSDNCVVDGSNPWSWAIYTYEARCW